MKYIIAIMTIALAPMAAFAQYDQTIQVSPIVDGLITRTGYEQMAAYDNGSGQVPTEEENPSEAPASAVATGTPVVAVIGTRYVETDRASVQISFDSANAVFEYSTRPRVYVEYKNTETGETRTTPVMFESTGSRVHTLDLYELVPETVYTYRAVVSFDGWTHKSSPVTFTTPKETTSSNTINYFGGTSNTTTTGGGSFWTFWTNLFGGSSSSSATTTVKNKIMTGGTAHNARAALSITDEEARVDHGDKVTFTVKYQNLKSESLMSTEIVVQLPEQYEFISSPADVTYDEEANTVSFIAGRVPGNTLKSFTFTARAIGDGNGDIHTTAVMDYEGGSLTASDRDAYHSGTKSLLGASVFGAGFFPQTFTGWVLIILLITTVIIFARRYQTAPVEKPAEQKTA